MFPGLLTLCLDAKDLSGMRHFYEALGLKVHIDRPSNVLLNNGDVDIALMTFLDAPCLNFRGADPFEMQAVMTGAGLDLEGKPEQYDKAERNADANGQSWLTRDPDGNVVFFDTNDAETGARGDALALQRVLDATSKQLINVGAPQACRDALRTKVLEVFMPDGLRAQTDMGLDTKPLTQTEQFPGSFTLCLKVADTGTSRAFYEALGLEITGNNDDQWVQMGNGDCQLALMSFLDANWLNFRGADPFKVHEQMSAAGLSPPGEPVRYTEEEFGSPGAHWQTQDPDGNVVYFDTTDPELIEPGDPVALKTVLQRAHRQLLNIGAEQACLDVFQTEVIDKFVS